MTKDEARELRKRMRTVSGREEVIEHCGTVCVNCGSEVNIQYHHIVPLECGGRDILSNMVALCGFCHCLAHSKQIRKIERELAGRKPIPKPENADEILGKYFRGDIGYKGAKAALGLKSSWKLREVWYFEEYLTIHHIAYYRNYRDTLTCARSKPNTLKRESVKLASITFDNGEEKEYFGEPAALFDKSETAKPNLKTR